MTAKVVDVVIMGGGLAGLGLAKQLKMLAPEISIVVIERRAFPIPDTTAKVGESTVEIGSHYLTEYLGLKKHFQQHHLQKYGLRCFMGEPQPDFSQQDELGVSQLFGIPTYQLERGVLENHLYSDVQAMGVEVIDNGTIDDFQLGKNSHQVQVTADGVTTHLECRWLTDASGRQGLIKNRLNLHKPSGHKGNAIWFRIDKTVAVDEWSHDADWQARLHCQGKRWLSTNHLMGPGYWVWIIPLGSGATSIGLVMDDQALDESQIEDFDSTLRWLNEHHPLLAHQIAEATLMDFVLVRDYSYSCKRVFSSDGWFLTGEAGLFADPFYSPGSDFIAISNTLIADLITKEYAEQNTSLDTVTYETFYQSVFANTLSLYAHQYGGFGDRRMMSVKLVWDYSYYWGVLSLLFFSKTMVNGPLMRELNPLLIKARQLNENMQEAMRQRAAQRLRYSPEGVFFDQYQVPSLREFNEVLKQAQTIDIAEALQRNINKLESLSMALSDMLSDDPETTIDDKEREVLGHYRQSVLS